MATPFKNFFNVPLIEQMGGHFKRIDPTFDAVQFTALATHELEKLELRERSIQICEALVQTLPDDFDAASTVLLSALHPEDQLELSGQSTDETGIAGWPIMPMADAIAHLGKDHPEQALAALGQMTCRFSSEFAIRHFFKSHQELTLNQCRKWAQHENFHIRRLASEGSRPLLPWGIRLHSFVDDPSPLIPLLEDLRDDPSEYVRRSVANNLNDIAKNQPDLVADIAHNWMKDASRERTKLVRHACRSLIKQGHQPTLKALGFGAPEVNLTRHEILTPTVKVGETLDFEIELTSTAKGPQNLIVDFLIHHVKANGTTSPKVFKWKEIRLPAGQSQSLVKSHSMKPVTTRVYYPGTHFWEVQVNGQSLAKEPFELISK